jgi:hypothetical protein
MTPREYLEAICIPSVEEFFREPTALRRAWTAVVALIHFEDYLAAHRGLTEHNKIQLRRELDQGCPPLRFLRDVGNANKHHRLTRGDHLGLSFDHIQVGKSAAFSDGSYFDDGSSFAEHDDVVRVEFEDKIIDLRHLCEECLSYFQTKA